jgi:hypothetical protein
MTDNIKVVGDSAWKSQFGLTGDPSNFANQFANAAGLGTFQDTDAFHHRLFSSFDTDGSQKISSTELGALLAKCGHNPNSSVV